MCLFLTVIVFYNRAKAKAKPELATVYITSKGNTMSITDDNYRIAVTSWIDKDGTTLSRSEYLERWEVCTINDLYGLAVFQSGGDAEIEELRALKTQFEALKSKVINKHFNDRSRSTLTGSPHPLNKEQAA